MEEVLIYASVDTTVASSRDVLDDGTTEGAHGSRSNIDRDNNASIESAQDFTHPPRESHSFERPRPNAAVFLDRRSSPQLASRQSTPFEQPRRSDINRRPPYSMRSTSSHSSIEARSNRRGNLDRDAIHRRSSKRSTRPVQVPDSDVTVDKNSRDLSWSAEEIDYEESGAWTLKHHQKGLLQKHDISESASGNLGHISINLAELHRMRLRKLQIKLVHQAVNMHYTAIEAGDWEDTLQQYSTYTFNTVFE
jgi:hypothetical protein